LKPPENALLIDAEAPPSRDSSSRSSAATVAWLRSRAFVGVSFA
jgi:hypothetical protein